MSRRQTFLNEGGAGRQRKGVLGDIVGRIGQQALAEMKQYARRLVTQGGMFNPAIEQQLADFNSWCMDKWVSPGGSADLLALCLAMYFLCRQPQGDMT